MNERSSHFPGRAALLLGAGFLLALAGCYSPGPQRSGYRSGPAVQVIESDDYVYYPRYEIYYNNTRHQYVYRDGRSWVNRPQPPAAWARDLAGAPSVHVDFHDAPDRHHADVVRKYPKTWKPAPPARADSSHSDGPRSDGPDDHRDNGRR